MATLYTEPRNDKITYHEWARLIQKTTFEARSFMALGLTNMNTSGQPQIELGSRLEVGGSLYECTADETIVNWAVTNNVTNYIYCAQNGGTAYFFFHFAPPAWNSVKGGWYLDSTYRAVAKFFYTDGQFNGKVILDSYNAIRAVNTEQPIPTTSGEEVAAAAVNQVKTITLPTGAYRYEMKAGNGGRGGSSKHNGEQNGGTGAEGQSSSGTFMLYNPTEIHYAIGGDGRDGENGQGDSGDGDTESGSGGACTGGSTFIDFGDRVLVCIGGSGGGGSGAAGTGSNGGGGGGGGGGYGTAEGGASQDGERGNGGSNNVGGTGGYGVGDGGGGGGGSGGNGGGSGKSGGEYGKSGSAGGGYGERGGSGGDGDKSDDGYESKGGQGGQSQTGENTSVSSKRRTRIQWQGGGAGGGGRGHNNNGGNGGGGLKSTSAGYLRIYRQW
jgi:hypothetical protein